MATNDSTRTTEDGTSGKSRRSAMQASSDSSSGLDISRRSAMKATAAAGVAAAGGASLAGTASGNLSDFKALEVDNTDNTIVTEDGDLFKMRGLNIPDPKRLDRTQPFRGKSKEQIVDKITNNDEGWHPRVIRVPAQPADIGEHPNGNTGPTWEEFAPEVVENESHPHLTMDRRLMRPCQPVAFDRDQLETYFNDHYDSVVQRCRERGVYCIIDFHRHWHEQPPGDGEGNGGPEGDARAENHLPYDSEHCLYWAYNDYYGEDHPASWGYVDQKYRNEEVDNYVRESDIGTGTPYDQENWVVNQDLVDEAILFWEVAAERYGDEPHVIFEPYNEPTAPGIWGPAGPDDGCGAYKQFGVWDTYREEFAAPIMDAVRQNESGDTENLIMMGLPGWCQATQALHWGGFDDGNVAAVWHNYAGHHASDLQNWLNDRSYEYMAMPDRWVDIPESESPQACYGWQPYEAQALQEGQEVHPIAVTEFGWQDPGYTEEQLPEGGSVDISSWLRGSTAGQGTTNEYGQPFLDEMEPDDRISWVAWCADPRWLTAMFQVDFEINEGNFDLNDGNWYETPQSEYPTGCPENPCSWSLWQDPNMGQHIKERLADNAEDRVPFEFTNHGGTTTPPENCENGEMVGDKCITDPDGDGSYEDFNGDGEMTHADVQEFFGVQHRPTWKQPSMFDFNGNEAVGHGDVISLFEEVGTSGL